MSTRTITLLLALGLLLALAPAVPAEGPRADATPGGTPFLVGFVDVPPRAEFLGHAVERVDDALSFAVIRVQGDPSAFLARAEHDPRVRYARADDPGAYRASAAPNDPLAPAQWAWRRVNVSGAWNVTMGASSILVAVLDSGVERTHPDLAGPRLLAGYDFVNRDRDPGDDCGHGTHVTGTLAATTGNSLGVAGAAQVSVLPVKVLNAYCAGSWSNVASGIRYAADQGARVISMSLGCGVSCYDQATADAIDYAWAKGALVVVAAGNEGPCEACVQFPASHPRAVAVACSDEADALCATSSRGLGVLAAPGRNILSTTRGGGYGWNNGTSMSAPHVSGAAALALSVDAGLTNARLRTLLLATARDAGAPGVDGTYGHGILDMGALVAAVTDGAAGSAAPALAFAPARSDLAVAKGATARHAFTLLNSGDAAAAVQLSLGGGAAGWKASLDRASLVLAPGGSATVTVSVKAPGSARSGDGVTLSLAAAGGGAIARATVSTVVP